MDENKPVGWSAEVRRAFHEQALFAGIPFNIAIGMWLPVMGTAHALRSFWPLIIAAVVHGLVAYLYTKDADFFEVWRRSLKTKTDFLDAD